MSFFNDFMKVLLFLFLVAMCVTIPTVFIQLGGKLFDCDFIQFMYENEVFAFFYIVVFGSVVAISLFYFYNNNRK